MFDMVDTVFNHGRALIVCLFLQESIKLKESNLYKIWNADTAFLLGGADMNVWERLLKKSDVIGMSLLFCYVM